LTETVIKEGGENIEETLSGIVISRDWLSVEEIDELADRGREERYSY